MAPPMSIVPALPALSPSLVFRRRRRAGFLPFAEPRSRSYYFARNGVFRAVKRLGLVGQEVLVPAYHHGVELEALVAAGATLSFYRVGARWDVDADEVERRIGPKTRALYLIHYAGFPGPWRELRALADRRGLVLLEDCALSLLSSDGEIPLGSVGDAAIFCLYKTLPVPHGGALILRTPGGEPEAVLPPPPVASTLSHAASSFLSHAAFAWGGWGAAASDAIRRFGRRTVRAAKVERVATGTQHFSARDVDLGQSAWVRWLAERVDAAEIVERRRRNYFHLLARLADVGQPVRTELPAGVCPLFFPIRVPDKAAVQEALLARGVETVDFWRDFHPACPADGFPDVAALRRTVLEVPCHQDLDEPTIERVAESVAQVVRQVAGRRGSRSLGGVA